MPFTHDSDRDAAQRSLIIHSKDGLFNDETLRQVLDEQGDLWEGDTPTLADLAEVAAELQGMHREQLTEVALSQSLCPLHFIDYAICFDDRDPECSAIRFIHPSHDT